MKGKIHDLTNIDKQKRIEFIYGRKNQDKSLETRNIELQKRIFDLNWTISTCIDLLKEGNSEKALKLLKKVFYEK